MTRIIINGCCGAMGKMTAETAAGDPRYSVVAGVDVSECAAFPFPVYRSIADCAEEADCVVDFSTAKITDRVLECCAAKKLPLVLATTGLSEETLARLAEAGKVIPIVYSANMSLGINTMTRIAQLITPVLAEAGFDIEIVEKHHRRKLDAPSGTALLIADAVNEGAGNKYHYTFDRSTRREKRDPEEIGISSVRGGTIVGEHDLIFAGEDEVIEITHHAYSRAVFARGALTAAAFLAGKEPGVYSMKDVIG